MTWKPSGLVATLPYVQVLQVESDCPPPEEVLPLLAFIQELTLVVTYVAIGFATLGLVYSGMLFMWWGPEGKQKGKMLAQYIIIGLVIVLSASFVIDWIVTAIPLCEEGI